jgi:hypothetical protein
MHFWLCRHATGNRLYAIDFASYSDALAKATAEKNALASAK